jgi:hypothetical protein
MANFVDEGYFACQGPIGPGTTNLQGRGLLCMDGGAGCNPRVIMKDGGDVTFLNVAAGSILPIHIRAYVSGSGGFVVLD